jgi:hypothetical protein
MFVKLVSDRRQIRRLMIRRHESDRLRRLRKTVFVARRTQLVLPQVNRLRLVSLRCRRKITRNKIPSTMQVKVPLEAGRPIQLRVLQPINNRSVILNSEVQLPPIIPLQINRVQVNRMLVNRMLVNLSVSRK